MSNLPIVVDGAWLQERLDDPHLRLLDATTHLRFLTGGGVELVAGRDGYVREHIPGALFADLMDALGRPGAPQPITVPDSARFAAAMGALGRRRRARTSSSTTSSIPTSGPTATSSGRRDCGGTCAWRASPTSAVLDGGLGAWKAEGRPVTDAPSPGHPPADFAAARRPELLVSTEEVEAAVGDAETVLINALPPQAFAAGRIPASHNVPFSAIVDPQTGPLPRARGHPRGASSASAPWTRPSGPVTYCGGGIAATVAALGLARAGARRRRGLRRLDDRMDRGRRTPAGGGGLASGAAHAPKAHHPLPGRRPGRVVKGVHFVGPTRRRRSGGARRLATTRGGRRAVSSTSPPPATSATVVDRAAHRGRGIVPLTVGGGVRTGRARLLGAGADKVAVNTAAVEAARAAEGVADMYGAAVRHGGIDAERARVGRLGGHMRGGRNRPASTRSPGPEGASAARGDPAHGMDRDGTRAATTSS